MNYLFKCQLSRKKLRLNITFRFTKSLHNAFLSVTILPINKSIVYTFLDTSKTFEMFYLNTDRNYFYNIFLKVNIFNIEELK